MTTEEREKATPKQLISEINRLENENLKLHDDLLREESQNESLNDAKREIEDENWENEKELDNVRSLSRNYPEPPDDIAKEEKLSLFYEYSKCFSFEELNAMFKDAYWKKENDYELPKSYTK